MIETIDQQHKLSAGDVVTANLCKLGTQSFKSFWTGPAWSYFLENVEEGQIPLKIVDEKGYSYDINTFLDLIETLELKV